MGDVNIKALVFKLIFVHLRYGSAQLLISNATVKITNCNLRRNTDESYNGCAKGQYRNIAPGEVYKQTDSKQTGA
jgi:hypothetical protein